MLGRRAVEEVKERRQRGSRFLAQALEGGLSSPETGPCSGAGREDWGLGFGRVDFAMLCRYAGGSSKWAFGFPGLESGSNW